MGRVGSFLGSLIVVLALCAPAASAATQVSPRNQNAQYFDFASNTSGRYLLAWQSYGNDGFERLYAFDGDADLAIRPRRRVKLAGGGASDPHVAVASDGSELVAWATRVRRSYSSGLKVAFRRPGGRWRKQTITRRGTWGPEGVLFGPSGEGVILWTVRRRSGHEVLLAARRPPGANRFGKEMVLYREPTHGGIMEVEGAFDAAGRLTLTWERSAVFCGGGVAEKHGPCRTTRPALFVVSDALAGGRIEPRNLCSLCSDASLAVAPSGAAAVVMTALGRRGSFQIRLSRRNAGSEFGAARVISGDGQDDYHPTVVMAPDGYLVAAWIHRKYSDPYSELVIERLHLAHAEAGEPISAPIPYTRYRSRTSGPFAFNARNGMPALGWLGGRERIFAARVDREGRVGRGVPITRPRADEFPGVAVGTRRSVIFWFDYWNEDRILGRHFSIP